MKNIKGFTLIELLVVVTIIVILSAIGMANYRPFVEKSRDSRRKSDLESIRGALELYRADEGAYPADLPICGGSLSGTGGTEYMSNFPCDPKEETTYGYVSPTTLSYEIGAVMEVDTKTCSNLTGANSCGTDLQCNYCLQNP